MSTVGIGFLTSFMCQKYFTSFFACLLGDWPESSESAGSRVGASCGQVWDTNGGVILEAEGLVWGRHHEWKLHEGADFSQDFSTGQDWHNSMSWVAPLSKVIIMILNCVLRAPLQSELQRWSLAQLKSNDYMF